MATWLAGKCVAGSPPAAGLTWEKRYRRSGVERKNRAIAIIVTGYLPVSAGRIPTETAVFVVSFAS